MTWTAIDAAKHAAGKPVVGAGGWAEEILGNLNHLYGVLGTIAAGDIPNGSFEIDSDADGIPDNWTRSLYPGGTGARDTLTPAHGAAGIKLTHPGGASNGGGSFTSDYVACSPSLPEILGLIHWATAAGMHNKIQITYYNSAKVELSTADLYDSTANPTTATTLLLGFTPPATARFYKLILSGGLTDIDVAGSAYFDGLTLSPGRSARWRPALADATLAEQSTSSLSWVNAGSFVITLPHRGLPVALSFASELKGGDYDSQNGVSYSAYQRWVVGSNYSATNTVTNSSGVYVTFANIIGVSDVAADGRLTVVQQLMKESGGGTTTFGRKAATDTKSRYLPEEF